MIQTEYNRNICTSEILKIGFGYRKLKIDGQISGRFVLLPNGSRTAHAVPSYETPLWSGITYEWFKSEIICKEKPWICIQYP